MKPTTFVKILSLASMGIGLYWLTGTLHPLGKIATEPLSVWDIPFFGIMLPLLSVPGFLGLYFGYQAFRRQDAVSVRRLVAACCLYLFFFSLGWIDHETKLLFPQLSEMTQSSLGGFFLTVMAIILYWFAVRYLLRWCGLEVPPVRRSLTRLPIFLVAFQLQNTVQNLGFDIARLKTGQKHPSGSSWELAAFGSSLVLAVIVYKLGVRLFVEQKINESLCLLPENYPNESVIRF